MKVAVIIPCFNEQDCIVSVIDDIIANTPKGEDWSIIVVNDCSTDGTLKVLHADGRAIVLDLPCNQGVGAAVQTGFKYAARNGFDYALKFDGDGQHRADNIKVLLKPLKDKEADFVIASRFINDDNVGFKSTFLRRAGINFFRIFIKIFSGFAPTDATSGFRAYNEKALKFATLHYPNFDYPEPEEIVLMKKNGFKIKEVCSEMRERQGGVSSINPLKSVYYMIKVAFAILMVAMRPKEKDID